MINELELEDGLVINVKHFCAIRKNQETYRIIVSFLNGNRLLKDYYIWASYEYINDFLGSTERFSDEIIVKFALEFVRKRYSDNDNLIPRENGMVCTNKDGCHIVNDPQNFIHPLEREDS